MRFQIAVDHALRVGGFQSPANLRHDGGGFRGLQFFLAAHQALQVLTFDVLHGDELDAVGLAQIENADYVFVSDLPREDQFLFETLQDFRIRGHVAANYFERHLALQFAVARVVDRAHAALAEHPNNLVAFAQQRARAQNFRRSSNNSVSGGDRPALSGSREGVIRRERVIASRQRRGALHARDGFLRICSVALRTDHGGTRPSTGRTVSL